MMFRLTAYKIKQNGTVWRLSETSLPEDGHVRPKHVVKDMECI
jgi:hypothetical protein